MKWAYGFLFLVLFASLGFLSLKNAPQKEVSITAASIRVSPRPSEPINTPETASIFVPYWGLGTDKIDSNAYGELLYFGVSVNTQGIDTDDDGYKKLDSFLRLTDDKSYKLLVIRMVDQKTNFEILKNQTTQKTITTDSIQLAREKGFSGIVVNLEVTSLPFSSITNEINAFITDFSKPLKKQNLELGITLNGDTFSKIRPFDVAYLSKQVDKVYLMSYDFSKAKGDPGPNFPLSGHEIYGYDFKTMITDFLNLVPRDKITVVFGMFGYDWTLDANNKPVGIAKSLSLLEAQQKFVPTCSLKNCVVEREEKSAETHVTYTDSALQNHSVWFEDLESVEKKKVFLKERGINSVSFWAYSYF